MTSLTDQVRSVLYNQISSKSKEPTLDRSGLQGFFALILKYCVISVAILILNSECMHIFHIVKISAFNNSYTYTRIRHMNLSSPSEHKQVVHSPLFTAAKQSWDQPGSLGSQ